MSEEDPKGTTTMKVFATTASVDQGLESSASTTHLTKAPTKRDKIRMGVAIAGFIVSVAIIVLATVFGAIAAGKKGGGGEVDPSYRLPRTLFPEAYELKLQPFVHGNLSIAGYLQVTMKIMARTDNITIHLANITTHNDTIKVQTYTSTSTQVWEEVKVTGLKYDPKREWLVIRLGRELRQYDRVVLSMFFTGFLNDQLKGFYRSTYTNADGETVRLAATFLSPNNARRAFPCLDEPEMKATFKVSLAAESNMTVLANMPLNRSESIHDQEGWCWYHFETSLPMSTYLVAFLVSDFDDINNGTFSAWSRSEVLEETEYALEVGPKLLHFFELYLYRPYPLAKVDLVALPDFAAGAMENWGLVTFREERLLVPEEASAEARQAMVMTTAHELAHQWFGNLVTAKWWSDILLKEGVTSFLENVGTDAVEPGWGVLEQMVLTMQAVMVSDGLPSTHPVSQAVNTPADIGQIFDTIAYSKGMSVIRMLHHFMTDMHFVIGLRLYLGAYEYGVASLDDFWSVMAEAARLGNVFLPPATSVKDIMDTWTLQAGYPVVTVTRTEDGRSATLTQERFLLTGNMTEVEGAAPQRWWVPLSYTSRPEADLIEVPGARAWLSPGEALTLDHGLPPREDWVLFNVHGAGYFRVNYDPDNWARLNDQLLDNHTDINTTSRSQLLDDALSLARAGRLSYEVALGLHEYLPEEEEYVPWSSALAGLSYLEQMLTRTAGYGRLKRHLLSLLEPLYDQVGFEDDLDDPHLQQRKRALAVGWACKLGHQDCVARAVHQFEAWLANETQVSPNIKSTVYCMGVAEGGQEAWDGVWERYLQTEKPEEQTQLLKALGCAKELWILSRYLDLAFTEDGGIRKQNIGAVFSSVSSNDVGRTLAWNYLRGNWEKIVAYYDTFSSAASLLQSATKEFNTRVEKKELEAFCEAHEDSLSTSSSAVKLVLERTDTNIAWMDNYYELINNWLEAKELMEEGEGEGEGEGE